jgi:hypothetical protein
MKIRVVSARDEISTVLPNEKIVHLAFRPSSVDIFKLCDVCPKLEALQLPLSYKRTLSKSIHMFLEMQNVELLEGDVWGHRKDLCEHYVISNDILDTIISMKQKKKPVEDILETMKEDFKLNEDMANYIINAVKA